MTIKYFVRHCPWMEDRVKNIERMKRTIKDLIVIEDVDRDGYKSFIRACKEMNDTGGILLEDDVELCDGFLTLSSDIVKEKGESLISFFERPKTALGTKLVGGSNFLWMQCIYMPPQLPNKICAYYEKFLEERPIKAKGMATDCLIAYALTKLKLKYWRIRPTLVQHLPFESAIGKRPKNRQSPYYIDYKG